MNITLDPATLVARDFGCLEPAQPEWLDQRAYWEDFNARFFRSNGRSYAPERDSNVLNWLSAPDRAPFSAMTGELLATLEQRADLSDIDIVILAHWLPDLHLGTSVTNFALHRLGLEDGFGFAISDRGLSAPLFSLDCAARYLRDGRRKALLLVMDQRHLLYRSEVVDRLNPVNSAAAFLLEENGTGLRYEGYARRPGTPAADVPGAVADLCVRHGLARADVAVIAPPALCPALAGDGPVTASRPERLCAAPFAALAGVGGQDVILLSHEGETLTSLVLRAGTRPA
ncbi:hypothetical protein KM176_20365 [Pseudooceanicola sp. CBS1P-1]|uniref:Uncharacterized protein n=1 Tax=Pseudooceanicola albus TaxID=2692189 RepID=A0A6L7GA74_9RHOB|nr:MULTISPECIES: hypothetical protein [Pseudooceanicola]MBT9386236.1 hypothetical protein [Pseudooceanicola endophyticus]MXN20286.1 hypothetical protein [Pseudooceanicola albus]